MSVPKGAPLKQRKIFPDELVTPLTTLPGIGKRGAENFLKMGIVTCGDLLRHYPVRYEDRSTLRPISQFQEGPVYTIVTIIAHDYLFFKGKKTLKVHIEDSEGGRAALVCFGRGFLGQSLAVDTQHKVFGTFQFKFGEIQTSSFDIEPVSSETAETNTGNINNYDKETQPFLPIYPSTENLSQKVIRNGVKTILSRHLTGLTGGIPSYLCEEYKLLTWDEAIKTIHFPSDISQIEDARKTLITEEIFLLQLAIARESLTSSSKRTMERSGKITLQTDLLTKVKKSLPFQLTGDQDRAINDILNDISSREVMNRLLQGEVGSGKTLVAFLSALPYIEIPGGQVALMVPTELLAKQHFANALTLLAPYGIKIGLLTGSLPSEERKTTVEKIATGEINFVIGTHALFTENVNFKKLLYVILDEQHRFGVHQRQALIEKGINLSSGSSSESSLGPPPDTLSMSATPIPRTLALTAYGNLTVSTIKELPKGRKPIETHLTRLGNEHKVYDFVHKELAKGRQAYFVYPLIQQSEKIDLKDAQSMYEKLSREIFPQYKTALLHSRLKNEEKESVMEQFKNQEVQILIATSVVEVGVDIPNATIMVIEQAERFGLSALHQLRGRIGRGEHASFAFLVYGNNLTEEGKQRLMVMKENSDGFLIAEEDLKIRGPGEIAGERQSGYYKLRIASYSNDWDIWKSTRNSVRKIIDEDPGLLLEKNRQLRELFEYAPPFAVKYATTG